MMVLDRWFLTGAISEWWFSLIMCLKIQGFRTKKMDLSLVEFLTQA